MDLRQEYMKAWDNPYFQQFASKYNEDMLQFMSELDKPYKNELMQQEIHGYFEQNNDVRMAKEELAKTKKKLKIKQTEVKRPDEDKLDRMKNYGRWYLKPSDFRRVSRDESEEEE